MKNQEISREYIKKHTAIVILAFAEYESLELSLATHARFSVHAGIPIFILQNGRGTYDTERTCAVGRRYQDLYPQTIRVITHIAPQKPYSAIEELFHDDLFKEYQYVIKLDDDVMVLTPDWIDKLIDCYISSLKQEGDKLAYVTTLVNNNPFGFKTLIDSCPELSREYFSRLARPHQIGNYQDDHYNPYRIVPKETVFDGGFGTIWRLPYLARWIHEKTTMQPEHYIQSTSGFPVVEFDTRKRYSINCMMFERQLWTDISNGSKDDEEMLHIYCLLNGKKVFADLSVPMVHLAFNSQRNEIRDMIPKIRTVYERFLALPFPIAVCDNKLVEIENRLRYMEGLRGSTSSRSFDESTSFKIGHTITFLPRKIRGGIRCYQENGMRYTANRVLVHLGLRNG